uniref:Uncharacterized protein n=1 Tax=Salvator merianae TaxID=96440 RepID=A0A8D0BT16_SALMN
LRALCLPPGLPRRVLPAVWPHRPGGPGGLQEQPGSSVSGMEASLWAEGQPWLVATAAGSEQTQEPERKGEGRAGKEERNGCCQLPGALPRSVDLRTRVGKGDTALLLPALPGSAGVEVLVEAAGGWAAFAPPGCSSACRKPLWRIRMRQEVLLFLSRPTRNG